MKKAKKARKAKKPTHILFVRHDSRSKDGRAHLVDGIKGAKKVIKDSYGFNVDQFELFEIKSRAKLKLNVEFA